MKSFKSILLAGLLILGACDGVDDSANTDEDKNEQQSVETNPSGIDGEDSDSQDQDGVGTPSTGLTEVCTTPEDVEENPGSIQEFIDFINLLPKPTTVNCILQALIRPIEINATSNGSSAQGAFSSKSPRIFVQMDRLIITVVPEGGGKDNIELAEVLGSNTLLSIKGDLHFPVTEQLGPAAPFRSIYTAGEAGCAGLCHGNYKEIKEHDDGIIEYASERLFPRTSSLVLPVDMEIWSDECIDNKNVDTRCQMFRAIYEHGDVRIFDFPNSGAAGNGLPFP